VRENRSDNHEWTIQRNWQYSVHEAQDEDKKKQQQKPRKKNQTSKTKQTNKNTQHRKLKR